MNLLGAMYSAVMFLGGTNTSAVQSVVAVERTVFYREKAAGMYSALPYAFAQVRTTEIYLSHSWLQVDIWTDICFLISHRWPSRPFTSQSKLSYTAFSFTLWLDSIGQSIHSFGSISSYLCVSSTSRLTGWCLSHSLQITRLLRLSCRFSSASGICSLVSSLQER